MPTISVTIEDDERDPPEETIEIPAYWCICDRCRGEGKSSAYLGAFTREQMYEDPDFAEEYFNGNYDRTCEECKGSGKVLQPDEEACEKNADYKRALDHLRDQAQWRAEVRREQINEMRMLGEIGPSDCY